MVPTQLLGLLGVALLWGITNPFLKRAAKGVRSASSAKRSFVRRLFEELVYLFKNWRYTVPFGINQLGSVLFYYTLSQLDMSLVVPVANSLTFMVTLITGQILGDNTPNFYTLVGTVLVVVGTAISLSSHIA